MTKLKKLNQNYDQIKKTKPKLLPNEYLSLKKIIHRRIDGQEFIFQQKSCRKMIY